MDLLQFSAALVSALAWPLTVLVALSIFRAPIARLLSNVRRVKGVGLELDVSSEIRQLEFEVKEVRPNILDRLQGPNTGTAVAQGRTELHEQIAALAELSPGAAISFAWTRLERRLRQYLDQVPEYKGKAAFLSTRVVMDSLLDRGMIDQGLYKILDRLRDIRNHAVHAASDSQEPSLSDAEDYAQLAVGFINGLDLGIVQEAMEIKRAKGMAVSRVEASRI